MSIKSIIYLGAIIYYPITANQNMPMVANNRFAQLNNQQGNLMALNPKDNKDNKNIEITQLSQED